MNFNIKELNELIYSLGITASKGMMCDKDLNVSLLNKLYDELNNKIAEEAIDEEVEYNSHFVGNRETNENELHMLTSFPIVDTFTSEESKPKKFGEGTAQSILDYVDIKGAVSHKELNEYYQSLNGSNTFSWCLRNLQIPYKNRKTQRYLAKEGRSGSNAKWIVKVANPSNWVVKEY